MNQLEDHLLSWLEDEMSSRAADDIDSIRLNACTVPHLSLTPCKLLSGGRFPLRMPRVPRSSCHGHHALITSRFNNFTLAVGRYF